jgi:autotransporter-associated beta strand protein
MPVEKGLLLVCGKTGRVVGLNRRYRWARWFFPITALGALVWYLVRVIPKPSRAAYPCQLAAAPFAFSGLAYILSLVGLPIAFRKGRRFLYQHRYAAAGVCLALGLIFTGVVKDLIEFKVRSEDTGTFTPSDTPNTPVGTARGINPGRVAWAYDLTACNWNGSANYWHSSANNDQAKITALMNKTICSVAGQPAISNAWDVLFKHKNGGTPYMHGEKIAIKLNLNNGGNNDNQIDASPQTVHALLDGLVNQFGVSQTNIILCDPARENQCSTVSNHCRTSFPNVNYDSNLGGFTANAFAYSAAGPTERSLSAAIVNSKYLITLAILKRHCTPSATFGTDGVNYGNAGVTLIFKSTWGIIGNGRSSQHGPLRDWNYPMNSYNQLVDMYGNRHVDGKTVLNILDGLYSGDRWNSIPRRWALAPFNTNWPSSIFASQDPVALESVGLDFLRAEMPLIANADRHIHEAAQANNPPSGTVYQPSGTRLASLGVHEHWNNATNKQYSRNLGTGSGIELVTLPADAYSVDITNPPIAASFTQGANVPIQAVVNNAANPVAQVVFYQNRTNLLGMDTNSPYAITWSNAPLGNWSLTAVATDSAGLSVTSSYVDISVTVASLAWDANPALPGAQDGSGSWNLSASNWWNGATNVAWPGALPANTTFGAASGAADTITLGTNITAGNLTFLRAGSGEYTIAGGHTLTLAGSPAINVTNGCSPVISSSVGGGGFSKTGSGTLTLSGSNTYAGMAAVNGGTLVLSGNNAGSTAGAAVASGAALRLAHANALKGALALNNGSTLQLRADTNTAFAPSGITLEAAANTLNLDVSNTTAGVTGRMLTLAGTLAFSSSLDQKIIVTGNSAYTLGLGAITATATGHNPYRLVNLNAVPGLATVIASFTSGGYGTILNLAGGGRITVAGNLGNTSNGSVWLFVNDGTTATLQGVTTKSNTGDAYRYFVQNGTLVVDHSGALTNNTTGTGLNMSRFILGPATNITGSGYSVPGGLLIATNNTCACAVYLGDSNYSNGGLKLGATVTNHVSDGDAGFTNSGTMTIGGQNTGGTNTYANPIILGWTPNRGKSVTLVAATGGAVDFTGGLLQNGTDTTAGVTVGDATHGGLVKLSGVNTYVGPTVVNNGTLLVNGALGTGAVTVSTNATLGGTGALTGAVTIQGGGVLSPGAGGIGALTLSSSLTLWTGSTTVMELAKSPLTNDQVRVAGLVTYGGTLVVTNLAGTLSGGETFQLFSAGSRSGNFTAVTGAPGPHLKWSFNPTNGVLTAQPTIPATATNLVWVSTRTNFQLQWPTEYTGWKLHSNASGLAMSNHWHLVPGSDGTNRMTITMDPAQSNVFYRMQPP